MRLFYIANARIPTEKAHGFTIAKACESFAQTGMDVALIVPKRENKFNKDLFGVYEIEKRFAVRYLPVIDAVHWSASRWASFLQELSFYGSLFIFMVGQTRKDIVVYTREPAVLLLSYIGFRVVYESHHVFGRRAIFFRLCRRATCIVTISKSLKSIFLSEGFESARVLVAPSGVDLDTFAIDISQTEARTRLGLPETARIGVYTGNFTTMGADKGISDILCALKDMKDLLFVAVGGSAADIKKYTDMAQDLSVSDHVRFVGQHTQKELALYQRAADVLLMPFPDTPHYRHHMSPVKMFEYMASGTPIIATDLPTIREVLSSENAVLISPGSPGQLASAVRTLLQSPERRRELASRARETVEAYSWKQRAQRVLAHIRAHT